MDCVTLDYCYVTFYLSSDMIPLTMSHLPKDYVTIIQRLCDNYPIAM